MNGGALVSWVDKQILSFDILEWSKKPINPINSQESGHKILLR